MTAQLRSVSVETLLESLGSKQPVPGGGAAASMTAALGLAAGRMVLAYSVGRPNLDEHEQANLEAMAAMDQWREEALALADADADAFERLSALWKLPEDAPERVEGWDDAVMAAIDPPLATCRLCRAACDQLTSLPGRTNPMLASDLAVAAVLLQAACAAAAWNVRVNLPSLRDESARAQLGAAAAEAVDACRALAASVEQAC